MNEKTIEAINDFKKTIMQLQSEGEDVSDVLDAIAAVERYRNTGVVETPQWAIDLEADMMPDTVRSEDMM